MKKLLTSILAMLTCFTCFAATACELPFGDKQPTTSEQPGTTSDLEGAKEALYDMYIVRDAETPKDYEVVNTTYYDGAYYNVSWSVDVTEGVAVKAGSEGMTLIDVDEYTLVEIPYVLTATISDAEGNTANVSFERVVTVTFDPSALHAPVEGVAYYMYLEQLNLDKTLYVTGEMDGNFFAMTADPAAAKEVYVKVVDGGYKFYVLNGETEYYITLEEYQKSGETKWRAKVLWTENDGTPFYYDTLGCWATTLEHDTFFIGTYQNFNTISASGSYYMTEEKMGTEQFPALLMLPENVETVTAADKLAAEKESLSTTLEIYEAGEVTLATAGSDYADVTISWVSSNTTYAVVGEGKVTYTLPTDADVTVTLTATLSVEGAESVTKDFTVIVKKPGSSIPVVGVGYTLSSTVSAGTTYFSGTLSSGRIDGKTTEADAVPVYFEATDTANEYYMYFMNGETKTYIYAATNASAGFAFSETIPSDVWVIDLAAKTIASKTTTRFIATQIASTYTTFNTYAISNLGSSDYQAAWIEEVEGGEVTPPTGGDDVGGGEGGNIEDNTTHTISEALAAEKGTEVVVAGTVCNIKEAWSPFGNLSVTIEDADGNELYVYRLKTKVVLGDIITVSGKMDEYNGAKQIASGATAVITGHNDSYVYTNKTLTEAVAADDGTNVIVSGTVSKIDYSWSSSNGNMSVTIKDTDDNTLYIYKLGTEVALGDVITVTGCVGSHNGAKQIVGATATIDTPHPCSEYTDATCKVPAKCTYCGRAKDDVLAGHNYVEGVCSVCNAVEPGSGVVAPTTVSVTLSSFGWANQSLNTSFSIDEKVTVSCEGGSNTGKYYNTGTSWRIYASDTPAGSVTITVPEGYELVSIKITTQTTDGTYAFLQYNGEDVCNKTVSVSGSSVKLQSVKNGSDGKHVRIQAIEVVYKPAN